MNKATFDPARLLTLYFRCGRNGSKTFTFVDSDGNPYSLIYEDVELNIYKNQGDKKVFITLPVSFSVNIVTATITAALSNVNEAEYYWELYRPDLGKTWLCGDAIFHNGKFDGVSDETSTVTVSSSGDDVTIIVSGETSLIATNRQTTNYTLVLTDADKMVELYSSSAISLTVPPNSSVAFPIGTVVLVNQYGSGASSVVAGSGVTIRSAGGALSLSAQYAGASLIKIATNEWYLNGSIV